MADLHLYDVIKRPVITEKSNLQSTDLNQYVFEVATDATKPAIRQAIERLFGVKVTNVWTMQARGKSRRVGQAKPGTRPAWKKAIVTLRQGDTIEGYGFEG